MKFPGKLVCDQQQLWYWCQLQNQPFSAYQSPTEWRSELLIPKQTKNTQKNFIFLVKIWDGLKFRAWNWKILVIVTPDRWSRTRIEFNIDERELLWMKHLSKKKKIIYLKTCCSRSLSICTKCACNLHFFQLDFAFDYHDDFSTFLRRSVVVVDRTNVKWSESSHQNSLRWAVCENISKAERKKYFNFYCSIHWWCWLLGAVVELRLALLSSRYGSIMSLEGFLGEMENALRARERDEETKVFVHSWNRLSLHCTLSKLSNKRENHA